MRLVGDRGRRRRLLAQVKARLDRVGTDPATVLDPEAVAELTALLDTVPDPTADVEIAHAAGWLYWFRYHALNPGDDEQDLANALAWFMPVYQTLPDLVPAQVRTNFDLLAAADDAQALADRAVTLLDQTLRTADRAALNTAIDLLRQALEASPADYPARDGWLSNLGVALRIRFERTGDRADLDEAIDAGRQALEASTADHSARSAMLSNLGLALRTRFDQTGDLADLDAAIGLLRQAVEASPADHRDRTSYLSNLGLALRDRFEQMGDLADLDEAIDVGRQAVAASPADHPARASYQSSLGLALRQRFERTGDQDDMDAAIDAGRQAVRVSPADHADRAIYLSNFGLALETRFERTGDLADLDAAIGLFRQAVAATLADHPARTSYLGNLGTALWNRFERTGDLADLDAAIGLFRQAVSAAPAEHPARAGRLSGLGAALWTRFERTADRADLDAAIDIGQQAMAAIPADHPDHAFYLSNLGIALWTRFERTADQADRDTAVSLLGRAVWALPADHPARAGMLSNVGAAVGIQFERTRDPIALDFAIDLFRQAVAATPADHPDQAGRLSNLGRSLQNQFERNGGRADLDAAIGAWRQAVAVEAAAPRARAVAARGLGRAAASGQRWPEAVAGFAAAAELLGLVAPRSLTRGDQEHLLEELGSVGADAAACCAHAGLTDQAVELFEQGRGVLLGQALDTRTDLTALAERHPSLAARFTALRDDVDRAGDPAGLRVVPLPRTDGTVEGRAEADRRDMERRLAAAVAFDEVIADIRRLPGFRGFLRPSRVAELLAAAAEGSVVVVTVSRFGSYALILAGDGVLDPVPLPGLTPETVHDQVVAFVSTLQDARSPVAGAGGRAAAEQRLSDTLGWLWDALAGPVLDRLGIIGPPPDDQPWPRLWWCVSGVLSFLPVHAAGYHDTRADAAPATVIDRVISSYTPTLRALTHARRPAPATSRDQGDGPGAEALVVAVAMPHTPGASDLPGALTEAAGLQRRFPGRVTVLTGPDATHETVLAALPGGRWAHFACHGASDLSNPSASCLLLTDHQQRPLTVVDVARLRLDDAGLAFLSACSTARPGDRLADEAIHLASAFQLAGYRHVIATLWPVGDQHAVDVAADIYTTLTSEGDVAGTVHTAVRRMRHRWAHLPSVWASHIHVGA